MAERPDENPTFETDEVQANRAMEQGLGVGARELAARLVADLPSKAETMKAIVAKSHP